MTKYESWKILNQCRGLYLSFKNITPNTPYLFVIKQKESSYELIVHSYWRLSYYDEIYYESYNLQNNFYRDLLLNHQDEDFIIKEVSLTDTFELHFLLQGKIQFSIPVLSSRPFGFKGLTKPMWEFKKRNKCLVCSY